MTEHIAEPKKNDAVTKPIEVWTLALVVLGLFGQAVKFALYDRPKANLELRKQEIEVARAESESVSITGEVLTPDLFVANGDRSVPLCPVVIKIRNDGQIPIHLDDLDFRVFVASLREITALERIESPQNGIVLASSNDDGAWPMASDVGIIDYNSPSWVEKVKLRRKPTGSIVQPGQTHIERLHLLAPTNVSSIVTKVDVTVHTKRSRYGWSGFANPLMCVPAVDIAPAPFDVPPKLAQ